MFVGPAAHARLDRFLVMAYDRDRAERSTDLWWIGICSREARAAPVRSLPSFGRNKQAAANHHGIYDSQ